MPVYRYGGSKAIGDFMSEHHQCLDCGATVWRTSSRCKSCANKLRWSNPGDARRAQLQSRNQAVRNGDTPYTDREWLHAKYVHQSLSIRQIATEAKCGVRTIARWLNAHGIETRSPTEGKRLNPLSGSKNPRWRDALRCDSCGVLRKHKTVHRNCMSCRNLKMRGSGSSNWKGIARLDVLIHRWCRRYWRPMVFLRDNYQCQHCGSGDINELHAHHIFPLSTLIGNLIHALALPVKTPEDRVNTAYALIGLRSVQSIANGITLCESCHKKQHAAGTNSYTHSGWSQHHPSA